MNRYLCSEVLMTPPAPGKAIAPVASSHSAVHDCPPHRLRFGIFCRGFAQQASRVFSRALRLDREFSIKDARARRKEGSANPEKRPTNRRSANAEAERITGKGASK